MAFSILVDKNIEKQLQKVIKTQTQKAISESRCEDISQNRAVHQIRKRCKKLRGLLRMFRYDFKDEKLYDEKNSYYKWIADLLAGSRDKKVLGDTYTKIIKKYNLNQNQFYDIAQNIENIKQDRDFTKPLSQKMEDIQNLLHANFADIDRYELKSKGIKSIEKGVKHTYKKAQKLYKLCKDNPESQTFHEWRKWVKYHGYQIDLLYKNEKCFLIQRKNRLKLLADLLGDEHDITVFKEYLQQVSASYEQEFESYLTQEQNYLRKVSYEIGDELFCSSSKKFLNYLKTIFAL